jgi:hypothetical protein
LRSYAISQAGPILSICFQGIKKEERLGRGASCDWTEVARSGPICLGPFLNASETTTRSVHECDVMVGCSGPGRSCFQLHTHILSIWGSSTTHTYYHLFIYISIKELKKRSGHRATDISIILQTLSLISRSNKDRAKDRAGPIYNRAIGPLTYQSYYRLSH